MGQELKRYIVKGGRLVESPEGNVYLRDDVVAAVERRVRTERERRAKGAWISTANAFDVLDGLLARLGVKAEKRRA